MHPSMRVVFHADDFGLTRAVNDGILEACERGLLRSTSLIVSGRAAEPAVAAARETPRLDVGLHLTLVEERPVLPLDRIPSLVRDGSLLPDHRTVALRYLRRLWKPSEACAELAAQWERFAAFGLEPSHCDGHQHLHLLPGVLPCVVDEARSRGVRFVRTDLADPIQGLGLRSFALVAVRGVSRLAWRRVSSADRQWLSSFTTIGFSHAGGGLTVSLLLERLDRIRQRYRPEIVEVMLHPGHRDSETERRYGHWNYRWEKDLELLLDPELPEALARRDIQVTSFRELAERAT